MKKGIIRAFALIAVVSAVGIARADTVAGIGGTYENDTNVNNPEGVSWTQGSAYSNESITGDLSSGSFNGNGAGTVYLTDSIGPGTTTANVIAQTSLTGLADGDTPTVLFSGLDLGPGTYYVITSSASGTGGLGWAVYSGADLATAGNTTNPEVVSFDTGSFAPADSYETETSLPFGFVVSGTPVAATPEPGSLALLGTGVLGIAGVLKRRFA